MRVDLLGPLRVTRDGVVIASPRTKERALLEALALRADRAVPPADLESALWGDHPPDTATRTLQAHVAHLRHDLDCDVIVREAAGYRLAVPPTDVDAVRLEALVAAGEQAWRNGDAGVAVQRFQEAEALWRGEPLADLADTPERQAHVDRLSSLRLQASEGRIRADLGRGRHREAIGELRRLLAGHPLREPLWALLMLALYRSGDQLEALRAHRRLRDLLDAELGVAPSPQLERLQVQILRQDPQLDLLPPPPPFEVPAAASSFVGRQGQAEAVADALVDGRLVTLHGPAGVGKSRLAQRCAEQVRTRFADGVWWVDLTVCIDGWDALNRIAATLGVSASPGVPLADALATHLRNRDILLVLDNCEHVAIPLAGHLVALLPSAPALRILATSRVPLHLAGEVRWDVRPLAVPDIGSDPESVWACESVRLFGDRLGRPPDEAGGPAEVARLCRALDGVPLALELVAVRAQHQTLAEVTEQLVAEVARASRPAARPRHHTDVTRAIDWSYAQFDPETRRLFDWLAVFPGEFDIPALDAVAGAIPGVAPASVTPRLARLVDASMVEARPVGHETRYRLLFVMREFAAARLRERGDTDAAWRAFAGHFRQICADAGPELNGRRPGGWLSRLELEMTNLRAAIEWSLANEAPERTLAFAPALGRVAWVAPVDLAANRTLLWRMVENADGATPGERGWGWQAVVTTAFLSGDVRGALEACGRAAELFEQAGDRIGLAAVHWHRGATLLLAAGDLDTAERVLRRGQELAHQTGAAAVEAWALAHLVQRAYFVGDVTDEIQEFHRRCESLADPQDRVLQAHLAMNRAGLALALGELDAAEDAARIAERSSRAAGVSTYEQAALLLAGMALLYQGRQEEAQVTALRAARIALDGGNSMQLGLALQQLARVADADDPARAAQLWGAATARSPVAPAWLPMLLPGRAAHRYGIAFDATCESGRILSGEAAIDLAVG